MSRDIDRPGAEPGYRGNAMTQDSDVVGAENTIDPVARVGRRYRAHCRRCRIGPHAIVRTGTIFYFDVFTREVPAMSRMEGAPDRVEPLPETLRARNRPLSWRCFLPVVVPSKTS